MVNHIEWDDAALEDLLNGIDGPVGRWLGEKSEEMTSYALAAAPLQKPQHWSWGKNSSSYLPRSFGYLKGGIRPVVGYSSSGRLFGGTNAPYGPTLFLERGGGRHGDAERIPFMSAALYAVSLD